MPHVAAVLLGYLVGSFPTAFLVVRRTAGKDIRVEGSGNVGGYNTARVTGSTTAGIVVGLTDGLKGLAVSVAGWAVAPDEPIIQYLAIVGAVIGHNYPVWLKFKGGRGLATCAGAICAVGLSYIVAWTLSWILFHRWRKDILDANVLATIFALTIVLAVPSAVIDTLRIRPVDASSYTVFATLLSVILFISHAEVFPIWFKRMTSKESSHAE